MAEKTGSNEVNLDESSVHADDEPAPAASPEDLATEAAIDRLEAITGGAYDEPPIIDGELAQKFDELDASTEEEVDALEVNLLQEDERPDPRDGTGRVVDDIAEVRIAKLTEVGPMQGDQGIVSVEPGRDDTSSVLRSHHPNTEVARAQSVVEGNVDQPMDETVEERKADEGTWA
jgi:hypothetical protein